ncbi:MAG: hypothetical protein GWN00_04095, partial [Aliifodinibius sp.]|nr:hypothetical protein [Fodinibius sp.]NIW98610.1 hypothetical protein [Phycisphaerae bacterium]NIY24014.1 hypothetical protein [Fodinibius sp.]
LKIIDTRQPNYLSPKTLREALELAKQYQDNFSFLAGGTDLWVNRHQGNNNSNCLIDISHINELQTVITAENSLKVGALVKLDQ